MHKFALKSFKLKIIYKIAMKQILRLCLIFKKLREKVRKKLEMKSRRKYIIEGKKIELNPKY